MHNLSEQLMSYNRELIRNNGAFYASHDHYQYFKDKVYTKNNKKDKKPNNTERYKPPIKKSLSVSPTKHGRQSDRERKINKNSNLRTHSVTDVVTPVSSPILNQKGQDVKQMTNMNNYIDKIFQVSKQSSSKRTANFVSTDKKHSVEYYNSETFRDPNELLSLKKEVSRTNSNSEYESPTISLRIFDTLDSKIREKKSYVPKLSEIDSINDDMRKYTFNANNNKNDKTEDEEYDIKIQYKKVDSDESNLSFNKIEPVMPSPKFNISKPKMMDVKSFLMNKDDDSIQEKVDDIIKDKSANSKKESNKQLNINENNLNSDKKYSNNNIGRFTFNPDTISYEEIQEYIADHQNENYQKYYQMKESPDKSTPRSSKSNTSRSLSNVFDNALTKIKVNKSKNVTKTLDINEFMRQKISEELKKKSDI